MSRSPAVPEAARATPKDDMRDEPEELAPAGSLRAFQQACNGELWKKYHQADRFAMESRDEYRLITGLAAGFGSGALLVAAIRVAFPPIRELHYVIDLEALGVIIALVVVVTGMLLNRHGQWLLRRYQSERFRLLKFRLLGRPELWTRTSGSEGWQNALRDGILEIESLTTKSLEHESQHELLPQFPSGEDCSQVDATTRERLFEYYRQKRLGFQMAYFERVKTRTERNWAANARLLPLVFVLSLSFVILHLFCDTIHQAMERAAAARASKTELSMRGPHLETAFPGAAAGEADERDLAAIKLERWCAVLVLASFAVPAVWAGFRTWRTANEFGRNLSRSVANLSTLDQISRRLEGAIDCATLFANIELCEYALALDQDEWLRLMLEAEWFG